jgi:hypothetical protein
MSAPDKSRPDGVKCIVRRGRAVRPDYPTACGRSALGEFLFANLAHARAAVAGKMAVRPCPKCLVALSAND